ncbi:hypothetical protein KNT64_gp206 [Pseudomonas phage PspYZU05]|uniref:Uncharacterized protein n=1 Tax=Pseudomonas phage PspYZU05 TaxID=1983556 RepID=A0A2U7NLY1_9CAUD|nr:hypothetical protein KNT64_gp206 [Pseudomonas phage PspYZU05]ASD52158.1 hypothetical protein PspYZU05_206 [Pseudomonas phage PspYZU05]
MQMKFKITNRQETIRQYMLHSGVSAPKGTNVDFTRVFTKEEIDIIDSTGVEIERALKKHILHRAKDLREIVSDQDSLKDKPEITEHGLCHHLSKRIETPKSLDTYRKDLILYIIRDMVSLWPKYSGSKSYPIPSVTEGHNHIMVFNYLPLWEGAYYTLRVELLDFIIECLEKNND